MYSTSNNYASRQVVEGENIHVLGGSSQARYANGGIYDSTNQPFVATETGYSAVPTGPQPTAYNGQLTSRDPASLPTEIKPLPRTNTDDPNELGVVDGAIVGNPGQVLHVVENKSMFSWPINNNAGRDAQITPQELQELEVNAHQPPGRLI